MAVKNISSTTQHTGLSTDSKPTASAGSKFYETDTKKKYVSDGTNWTEDPENTVDPNIELALGNNTTRSVKRIHGANVSVGASTTEPLTPRGALVWLTAALAVRIKAGGNAADDAGGAGAITVIVEGLDATGVAISEAIATNGATVSSPTTATFIRVNRAFVSEAGTYATPVNTGIITIETTGAVVMTTIEAGKGESRDGVYTVPLAQTAYLRRFKGQVDEAKEGSIDLFQRQDILDVTAPVTGARHVLGGIRHKGADESNMTSYEQFPALTDIWCDLTTGATNATGASVEIDLLLVND